MKHEAYALALKGQSREPSRVHLPLRLRRAWSRRSALAARRLIPPPTRTSSRAISACPNTKSRPVDTPSWRAYTWAQAAHEAPASEWHFVGRRTATGMLNAWPRVPGSVTHR